MFARFKIQRHAGSGSFFAAVLVALLAALTGCDKKVAWRGVGTDSRDAGRLPPAPMLHRGTSRWPDPMIRGRRGRPGSGRWLVASSLAPGCPGAGRRSRRSCSSATGTSGSARPRRPSARPGQPSSSSSGSSTWSRPACTWPMSWSANRAGWQGSWIIQGDALIGVDMSKAEIKDRDEKARTAVIVLPQPAVISARVNHEKSQQWDIKSRSWIPLASLLLGDRPAMEKQAMLEAQQLVERAAGSEDNRATARQGVEGMLGEFYRGVGWHVSVQWK